MSGALDQIAKEFSKSQNTIIRFEINLYQSSIQNAAGPFLRMVDQQCKKRKQPTVTLLALISLPQ